jgi:hypothetical protein
VQKHIFYFAAQEDNPIISSCSPTPDVIEAIPIETQPPTNTDEDHRSRPPTPGPIQNQVHTDTDEPRRSCPPIPDTTANVNEQQDGIRSNSSGFTNSFSICHKHNHFLPLFMTIDAFTNLYALFPLLFLYMEPQHLRHCVGRCRILKVFAICCKLLPSLMSPQTGAMLCVFAFPFFLLASQHFLF